MTGSSIGVTDWEFATVSYGAPLIEVAPCVRVLDVEVTCVPL